MMKSQRNDIEKNRLIKDDKRIGIDKRIITELIIISLMYNTILS